MRVRVIFLRQQNASSPFIENWQNLAQKVTLFQLSVNTYSPGYPCLDVS
jgi:hypothetical protein